MKKTARAETRRSLLFTLVVLGLIAAFVAVPFYFSSEAGNAGNDVSKKTGDHEHGLEDYDIRTDKAAAETIMSFRHTAGRSAVDIADIRDKFVAGENSLRQNVPTLKIEYHKELGNPEVIAPDVLQGRAFLTSPSNAKRANILRDFAKENTDLIALSRQQIDGLQITADYSNPEGELSFARLEQKINGIPVYRSEIRAGFSKQGAMFRVVNNLAPGLDYQMLSTDFGNPAEAVQRAAGYIDYKFKDNEKVLNANASNDLKAVFGLGDWAVTAEKMYFPIETGVARAAWRVLMWEPVYAYYVLVDAETGVMLHRENITHHQTQPATYNVYASPTNMVRTLANPAPLQPGPISPTLGSQGVLQPRSDVTLIGNEGPYAFNNLGWITDNTNGVHGHTDGNNVEAGLDRVTPNGVDAPVAGTNRVFRFIYTPGSGPNNGPGESPLTPEYQNGAVTHLFYLSNRYHAETYRLGFTEQARNFQHDNFGRGGLGNDRVSAEAQDSSGTNNANFSTPADGGRGRMQMFLWTIMTPNRDGDLDSEIVIHELTHGLFGRLHNGVSGTQAGQMNEGNSDFFAHVMLSEPTDPIEGIYVTGGYSTLNLRTAAPFSSVGNYYYGIRRFPKAVMSFTGGPNNRPHNPLTYADIDPTKINLTDGAFAPAFPGSATAVHDGGEIWSSMLWEVRAKLVQRLGFEQGNRKVLQLVMDGMKVSPSNPTMIQERNAILSAALNNGNGGDVGDVWAGFAIRGLGFSASNPTGNTVNEGFDLPNAALAANGFAVSDAAPGGNGNGVPEPGEIVMLTVPVTNITGNTVNNVTAAVTNGGTGNYGSIPNGQTVTREISYTIPAGAECGSLHSITIVVSSELGSQPPQTRSFRLGSPIAGGLTENFDGVTAPALPNGWTQAATGSSTGWVSATGTADTAPNSMRVPNPNTAGGADLESPEFTVTSPGAVLNFRNNYLTEATWDGGVLEIKIGNGAYQDIITAGGVWISGGYNGGVRGTGNPLGTRPAWSGNSNGYITTSVQLPASANGQLVRFKWRMGHDNAVAGTAWNIDSVSMINGYTCSPNQVTSKARADFDGDGKTDLSVFRPAEGNWYMKGSTAGFSAMKWGFGSDRLIPGDFDGDGKTDYAIARPNGANTALEFYIMKSSNSTVSGMQFGLTTDIPVIADYDGDGKADIAVFRPSNGYWYIMNSTAGYTSVAFGQAGDKPVPADYNGDGKANVAVFRPSDGFWYIARPTGLPAQNFDAIRFGLGDDKLVPADYDGDGKTDVAVFRPSNGFWYILKSTGGVQSTLFGISTDVPVPGDYDGDGKTDIAVYRSGTWHINRTTSGLMSEGFGIASDKPIPNHYLP